MATPTVTVADSGAVSNADLTLNIGTEGVDWDAGDVCVVHAVNHQSGHGGNTFTITADNAYSTLLAEEAHGSNSDFSHVVWYRVLTASDDTSLVIGTGGAGSLACGAVLIAGSDGVPKNATSQDTAGTSTSVVCPSITSVVDELVLRIIARGGNDYSSWSGPTFLYQAQTAAASDMGSIMAYETASGATTGTSTGTFTRTWAYGMGVTVTFAEPSSSGVGNLTGSKLVKSGRFKPTLMR